MKIVKDSAARAATLLPEEGEVIAEGLNQGFRDQGMEIWLARIPIDIQENSTTIWLWIGWVQHLRLCLIQPGGR